MMAKNAGFCLYKPDGSILKFVESTSEMQTVFSNVLEALDKEQQKLYGDSPMEETHGEKSDASSLDDGGNAPSSAIPSADTAVSPEVSSASASARGQASAETESRKGRRKRPIQPSAEISAPAPTTSVATRRSRRQSSNKLGAKSSDEGLLSLTYSYGSMDWDAIAMCWKPKTGGRKRKSRSSSKLVSAPAETNTVAPAKAAPPPPPQASSITTPHPVSKVAAAKPSMNTAAAAAAVAVAPAAAPDAAVTPKVTNGKKRKAWKCEFCRKRISTDYREACAHEVKCGKQIMMKRNENEENHQQHQQQQSESSSASNGHKGDLEESPSSSLPSEDSSFVRTAIYNPHLSSCEDGEEEQNNNGVFI